MLFYWKIIEVLEFISKKEGLQLPVELAARIATQSNRSLRRAILCLETCRVQQLSLFLNLFIFFTVDSFCSSELPLILMEHALMCFDDVDRYPFSDDQTVSPMDWEQYISEIASDIVQEQSPKRFAIYLCFCYCPLDQANSSFWTSYFLLVILALKML